MLLIYTDKRPISELTEFAPSGPIATRPVGYTATISESGAGLLAAERPDYFRAEDGDSRFTVTIDKLDGVAIQGTIRRR